MRAQGAAKVCLARFATENVRARRRKIFLDAFFDGKCARDASRRIGRAIASLELAVSEERWTDAARWRDALRRANGRCADYEAVFGGSEPGEDGYDD